VRGRAGCGAGSVNVAAPRLAAHLDRCWDAYGGGLIAEIARLLVRGRELLEQASPIDAQSRGNAEIELAMLSVIVSMVSGGRATDCLGLAAELAGRVADTHLSCDGLHRIGGLAVGVHAGMRAARLDAAEARFQQMLLLAQGLTAEGGEPGVSVDDVCAVVGCGGLHLAAAAAAAGDSRTSLALLDHSAITAAELGREHCVLGQYFGPQHVAATRGICLITLHRYEEALREGRAVTMESLIPLVRATLLRGLAEAADRLERTAAADVLRAQADLVAPSLPRQFDLDASASG
jgi:hypothetical protein